MWARVSSAIYNTTADFERLAAAIVTIRDSSRSSDTKQALEVPSTGDLKPPVPARDTRVMQSVDSDVSGGIPDVNKSVKDFYG